MATRSPPAPAPAPHGRRDRLAHAFIAPFPCAARPARLTAPAAAHPQLGASAPRRAARRAPAASSSPASPAAESRVLDGTPCFTRAIMSSPMPQPDRAAYLDAAADALHRFLTRAPDPAAPNRVQLTLLPPQLNPELDVYDRRFLLQLAWAALSVTASLRLRARVLVQGARKFGALPLSIAGLRRTFDADLDLSRDAWPPGAVRSGELEDPRDVDPDDDLVIVLSPTNAVSIPVVESVADLVQRVGDRPVVLLNPRLTDVPSHSGVMQVSGRAERMSFLDSFQTIFYLRLLFKAGTNYPLRGILYHAYPGPWQVWRSVNDANNYRLILSTETYPTPENITKAFSLDSYTQQKKLLQQSDEFSSPVASTEALFTSPSSLAALGLAALFAVLAISGGDFQTLLHKLALTSAK